MTIRNAMARVRRYVDARDVGWMAVLAVVTMSMILMARVSRGGDNLREVRETPSVVVVNRNEDAPPPVAPEVTPPSHIIHLACDQAQRELDDAIDAALDWSADLDRLLRGAEGKPIASDPRLVAQFQLLRGRERVAVRDIRRRMAEIRAVRADNSYEGDDERAQAVFVQVLDAQAWARGIADSYRADRRLLDSMNWTAHQLGVTSVDEAADLADAARELWIAPGRLRSTGRSHGFDPSFEEDLAQFGDVPRTASSYRGPLRIPERVPTDPRVLRKPRGEYGERDRVRTSPRRAARPTPPSARGTLNLVDLIRANLEWNGLTDVSLRRRAGRVVATGEVRTEREMAELEAIVESVLHTSELEFDNQVRVDG